MAYSYNYTFRNHSSLPLDSDGQNILTIFKRRGEERKGRGRKRERERERKWVNNIYPHLPMDNDDQNSLQSKSYTNICKLT